MDKDPIFWWKLGILIVIVAISAVGLYFTTP